jgi:molybdopterin-binding protein
VKIAIGEHTQISLITNSSCGRMEREVGDQVFAIVKATEIMVGKE